MNGTKRVICLTATQSTNEEVGQWDNRRISTTYHLDIYLPIIYLPPYLSSINNQPITTLYTFLSTSPSTIIHHLSTYGAQERRKERKAILIAFSLMACQQSAAAVQMPTPSC